MPTPAPTRPGRPRWRRIARRLVFLVASVVLVVAVLGVLALKTSTGRGKILSMVAGRVESSTGVRLTARDFRLELLRGVIELDDLALAAAAPGDAPPVLTAARARAVVRWSTLRGDRPTIESLQLDHPLLDLRAPFPVAADDPEASESTSPVIDVLELELTDGRLVGKAAGEAADIWLDRWHAEGIDIRGSFREGRIDVGAISGLLTLESHRREPVELQFDGSIAGSADWSEFTVGSLRIHGKGLSLEGHGRFSTTAPTAGLTFDLDVEPALLFPDLPSSGRAHGNGELRLVRSPQLALEGALRIDATDIPAELASPWLDGVDVRGPLDPTGTRLDIDTDLELAIALDREPASGAGDRVVGHAELTWRRDAEPLLEATVRSLTPKSGSSGEGVHLAFSGELTPGSPGRRRVAGELHAPAWMELLDGTLQSARVDLNEPDLAAALRQFGLDPSALPAWWPEGGAIIALEADGPLTAPRMKLDGRWEGRAETLATISARTLDGGSAPLPIGFEASLLPEAPGRRELSGELLAAGWHRIAEATIRDGKLKLDVEEIGDAEQELARRLPGLFPQGFVPDQVPAGLLRGTVAVRVDAAGPLTTPDLNVDATWEPTDGESVHVVASGRPSTNHPFVEAGGVAEFNVENLDLSPLGLVEGLRIEAASGSVDLDWPLRRCDARIVIVRPFEGIDSVETVLRLDEGTLHVEQATISAAGKSATLQATVPLGALARVFDGLEAFAAEPAGGPISMTVSDVDLPTLASFFDKEGALPPLRGVFDASMTFDPQDPFSSVGWLTLSAGGVDAEGASVDLTRTLRVEMADAKIVLPRTRLAPSGGLIGGSVPLDLSAVVELDPNWRGGDPLTSLVKEFTLDLDGQMDASILNRFLGGGAASGEVAISVDAGGSMEAPHAEIGIRGPGASIFYRRPYATRFEDLDIELTVNPDEVLLQRARARLNGGQAEMTGRFSPQDGLDANLKFEDAHFRLQFGIAALLRGDLSIDWPLEGRRRLSGKVVVERAVLRRPITLNNDALQALFDVSPESGVNPLLDSIDLDLDLLTDEGALIKNNVANLRADWGRLHVGGTAQNPLLDGRVDVQAGSIVTFLGMFYRIDEASLEWAGEPPAEPRWVLEWTSSEQDPSIVRSFQDDWFRPSELGPGQGGSLDFWSRDQVGTGGGGWQGVATGVTAQATSAGRTQLTYEPLPLFGETDTQARYTLSQELSSQLTFIASTNPREAEAQTYIVDVHRLPAPGSLRAQIFTNDRKNPGLTIQQTLLLGHRPTGATEERLLGSTTIDAPEGVKKRRLRRAIGYRKREPFPEGAALDVEVDVSDALRRKGYASADVDVGVEPTGSDKVNLQITVDPGTRVSFVFEGEEFPTATRRSIASAYRPADLGETLALDELQRETLRVLRGLGYLDPQVDVDSGPEDAANPEGPWQVRIRANGGRRAGLSLLVVEGVPDEEVRRITEIFATTTSRVDLTLESPPADAQLLRALAQRGFPQARIAGRELSDDGETLTVRIEPGARQRLASVEIEGLTEEDRVRLSETLQARKGEPLQMDRIGADARAIERDLRERGHADARVRGRIRPVADDQFLDIAVFYEADPGPSYRIEEVTFEGLGKSRRSWVNKVAGLEPGEPFRQRDVAEARARLFRTGVFERIQVSSETGDTAKSVNFEFEESRRWRLAYGGRWENGRGLSGVVDLLNQNSLGRGHLTGVRVIYGGYDQNVRLYHIIPRIIGERSSLELLIESRWERLTDTVDLKTNEAWAQLTFPLTRRTQNRLYVRFQDPEVTGASDDPNLPLDDRVVSPLLGWQVAFDNERRRAGELRRRGIFVGVDFIGSHTALGSDVTSVGVVSQLKYFMPIGRSEKGRFTWAQFWRGGWNEAKDGPIPFVDRFRAGGEFSVRGYPTNSLGPIGPDGLPLGGELLFIVNQEIHADLIRTERMGAISALVFFDAGNVFLDRSTLETGLFKSVGIGARYLSPFGPLRLDLAFPLDRRPDDPESKLYFGFGSVF